MISLNVQWVPVSDRSGAYQWSGYDASNKKLKTITYFGTGEMRGPKAAKVTTPPNSDYTDAYLSAFAAKPIPTRHVNHLSTAVFANVAPIPIKPSTTPLSTTKSTTTSKTHFNNANNIQTSSSVDKPVSFSPCLSSNYTSSNFSSERSTPYEPVSTTQYSSPQTQTFTSSYSTLIRTPPVPTVSNISSPSLDSQKSYTTFTSRSQPRLSTLPSVTRYETSLKNIYKPLPAYSFQSYPPSNTYTTSLSSPLSPPLSVESTLKPTVPLRSTSLSPTYSINQDVTREPTIVSTSKIEKQFDRPETLLFQHDEDLRSSQLEKASPMFCAPIIPSPVNREELKIEPERLHMEELQEVTSEPIRILENTLDKYDSLINQISEVLASVSPLSSTLSSMSPGRSVLDYQLSSDSSPVVPKKDIQPESNEQTTATIVETHTTQQTKPAYLVREDSYEKIVTAMSDIDKEMNASTEIQQSTNNVTEDKEEEEEKKILLTDEIHVQPLVEEIVLSSSIHEPTEFPVSSATEVEKKESEVSFQSKEEKKDIEVLPSDQHKVLSNIQGETEDTKVVSMEKTEIPCIKEDVNIVETITTLVDDQPKTCGAEEITDENQPAALVIEQKVNLANEEENKETQSSVEGQQQSPSIVEIETKSVTIEEHQVLPESTENNAKVINMLSTHEQLVPSVTQEMENQTVTPSTTDEQQVSSVGEIETKVIPTEHEHAIPDSVEQKAEETIIKSTDVQQVLPVLDVQKEEHNETKIISVDEQHVSPLIEEQANDELKVSAVEEQQAPVLIVTETKVASIHELNAFSKSTEQPEHEVEAPTVLEVPEEHKEEETKALSTDEQQIPTVSEEDEQKLEVPLVEEQQNLQTTEMENKEIANVSVLPEANEEESKTLPTNEQHVSSTMPVAEKEDETKVSSFAEQQVQPISEDEKKDESKIDESPITVLAEEKIDDLNVSSSEESQLRLAIDEPNVDKGTTLVEESPLAPETNDQNEIATISSSAEQETSSVTNEEIKVSISNVKEAPAVVDEVLAVVNEVPSVIEEVPKVVEEISAVVEQIPTPVEEVPKVVEEVPKVVEEISAVVEQIPTPVEEVPAVIEEVPKVVEEISAVVEQIPTPVEEVPAVIEEIPKVVEQISAVVEQIPTPVEEVPKVVEEVPKVVEEISAVVEQIPTPVEEVPAVIEEVPKVVEQISAVVEQIPTPVEEVPAVIEEVPKVVEEISAVVEQIPTPVEEVPKVVEEVPAAVEEVSAVVEEVPVVVDEVPAIVEEAPAVIEEVLAAAAAAEVPTVVDEVPVVVEVPKVVEELSTVIEEAPTVVDEVPAIVEEAPAVIEEVLAAAAEVPTVVDEVPAVVEVPKVVEELSTVIEEAPTVVDEVPAVVEIPKVVEELPAAVEEAPAVIEEVPKVVEEQSIISAMPAADTSANVLAQSSETKSDEEKFIAEQAAIKMINENVEPIEQQTDSLINQTNDLSTTGQERKTSNETILAKKTRKRVTWDEAVVDNEDNDNSSDDDDDDDVSSSETTLTPLENGIMSDVNNEDTTKSEATVNAEQQIISSDSGESQIISDEPFVIVDYADLQTIPSEQEINASFNHVDDNENLQIDNDEHNNQCNITEQQARSPSPFETSSIVSDSTSQDLTSSDVTESQSSLHERQLDATALAASQIDTLSLSLTDSSKEDTFTADDISTTTSDITSNEDMVKSSDDSESKQLDSKEEEEEEEEVTADLHKAETSALQTAKTISHEIETTKVEHITHSLQPSISSPIDTLPDTVSNRYISSDVYHGYMGEHKQFLPDTSDIHDEDNTTSLIASLRETLISSTIPLIESIQDVVSSMQTTTHSFKVENEMTEHVQDDTNLANANVTESIEHIINDQAQVEESKPTMHNSEELKTVFESLRQAAIAPITAIAETIQASMSNIESDNKEEASSSIEHIQENLSTTSPIITEIIQDAVTSVASSVDTHNIHEEIKKEYTEPSDNVLADSIIINSFNTTSTPVEPSIELKDAQESKIVETSSSEITESTSGVNEKESTAIVGIEFPPVTPQDEHLSTSNFVAVEHTNNSDKQETASADHLTEIIQLAEEKVSTSVLSVIQAVHDAHVSASTSTPCEQSDVTIEQEITERQTVTSEKLNEIVTEQSSDTDTLTDTKTTFEAIRDVITHPLAAISEKIHSVISTSTNEETEPTSVDDKISSGSTSEEIVLSTEQHSTEIENIPVVVEQQAESSETKTTLESLRDFVAHPLTTITEKIQTILTTSTTDDIPTCEQQNSMITNDQNKHEDMLSTTQTESNFESIPDTISKVSTTIIGKVQDGVLNSTEQTCSRREKEQILTTQESQSYLQDQVQGEHDIDATTVSSHITDDEKAIEKIEYQDGRTIDDVIQDILLHEITVDINNPLTITIHNLINDIINAVILRLSESSENIEHLVEENLSSDSNLTSPITVINVDDRSESSQSTTSHKTITNEDDRLDNQISSADLTWGDLLGDKCTDENIDQSSENKTVEITENKIITSFLDQPQVSSMTGITSQQTIIKTEIKDTKHPSSADIESDSTSGITQVENIPLKSSIDFRDSSPTNTEDDSLELIHALQGHSIIHPSAPLVQTQINETSPSASIIEKFDITSSPRPERSSSSATTSSQITSSDRYVSYAIHEMGDSSQERLPAFPLAADMPVYESIKASSDDNKDEKNLSESNGNINQNATKDDDLTEFDATENLTYSDDVLLQKLHTSAPNREKNLDASSTDEDVDDENFNELENNDISNIHRIMGEMTQQNDSTSQGLEQTYRRYDISNSSSISTKAATDDVYMIPGYSGLWRPSADDDDKRYSLTANDADDEDDKKQSTTTVKTRTIVRTTDPNKLHSFLQQHQEITSQDIKLPKDTYDVFNRPLNEFSFDISESDSFKTCASTINSSVTSKQHKQSELFTTPISEEQERQLSPEEKIFLIRERERGVSLPVTMKIQYDDMALRPSTSTPIDVPLYSTVQTDLPSPSTLGEQMQQATSSCHTSTTSLSSNESEKQKLPSQSWLNTTNTITTTSEGPDGPLESRTTIQKSAKGPISIAECDSQGKHITIENTSRSKSMVLAGWTIRQQCENGETLTYKFPENCLLRPNHSIKILTKPNESERKSTDLIASSLSSWHTGLNFVTTLINAEGKDRASLTKKTIFS